MTFQNNNAILQPCCVLPALHFTISQIQFSIWFYVGSVPIIISFVAVSLLTHWDSWDPVLLAVKKTAQFLCRRKGLVR